MRDLYYNKAFTDSDAPMDSLVIDDFLEENKDKPIEEQLKDVIHFWKLSDTMGKKFMMNFTRVYNLICASYDQNKVPETVLNIDKLFELVEQMQRVLTYFPQEEIDEYRKESEELLD